MTMPARKLNIRKSEKYLPAAFLKKLYGAVDSLRDLAYIQFQAETGLRIMDVLGTEVRNLDWEEHKVLIWDEKKDEWRTVYFPPFVGSTLRMYLKTRTEKYKRVFPFSEKTANRIVKHWCAKLGFAYSDKVSTHWLRHTFIRLSRRGGRDIKFVQQNTGDSLKTILEHYEGLTYEEMRAEAMKPLVG